MDRTSSGVISVVVGVLLVLGGGYAFTHATRGGVNPVTLGSFGALLAGIALTLFGASRVAAGSQEGLAGELGLEVKGALGLPGSERVEMEGDFGGFKVHVSRRETHSRGRYGGRLNETESYFFEITLPNPAGLSFYVGPDSLLSRPLGFLPPELEPARQWAWVDFMTVRGAPQGVAEYFFGNSANWPLFRDFFGRTSCRLDGDTMEFSLGEELGGLMAPSYAGSPQQIKDLIGQGLAVARLVAALPPSA
jgi:hypothetical protein